MKTSVALCTYNGEKFLKEQIDSILLQTVPINEIVVCDDGSTDKTIEILNAYKEKYPDIFRIYQNERNLRSVKNFEKAISLCENEIIFLSDQDDVWEKEKVKVFLEYFKNENDISVLCSNGYGIDEENNLLDVFTIWDLVSYMEKTTNKKFDYFRQISLMGNVATGASMAIRKSYLPMVLPFPIVIGLHHDEWIAMISSSQKTFHLLPNKLFKYRAHSAQQVGGVFYKNTKKSIQKLLLYHNTESEKKSFFFYKNILKRLSSAFQKNIFLKKETNNLYPIFETNLDNIKELYYSNKKDFKKAYPIRFFLLSVFDKINNKRQLN